METAPLAIPNRSFCSRIFQPMKEGFPRLRKIAKVPTKYSYDSVALSILG